MTLKNSEYRAIANLENGIRQYLDIDARATSADGFEPELYQLLLAVEGMPETLTATVGNIARRLHKRQYTTLALIAQAERSHLLKRSGTGASIVVHLTEEGQLVLAQGFEQHLQKLRAAAPNLAEALHLVDSSPILANRRNKRRLPR